MKHKEIILILTIILLSSFVNATDFSANLPVNGWSWENSKTDLYGNITLTDEGSPTFSTNKVVGTYSSSVPDGSHYIDADTTFNTTSDETTIVTWLNSSDWTPADTYRYVIGQYDAGSQFINLVSRDDAGAEIALEFSDGDYEIYGKDITWDANTWHHVAYGFNGSHAFIILDGSDASYYATSNYPTLTSQGATGMGGYKSTNTHDFVGLMDETYIFDRALTPEEIDQIDNCGRNGTAVYDCGAPPLLPSNFTITATNFVYGETLSSFNATIDNIFYNTSSGLINTSLLTDSTLLHNISISAKDHETRIYLNYNVSSSLSAILNSSYYKLIVSASSFNSSIPLVFSVNATTSNGYYNASTTVGNATVLIFDKNYNAIVTINATGYALTNAIINISDWITNYTFSNLYTTNSFNISIYNEKTEKLITTHNITIEFIGINVYNYTTDTGKLYVDLITPDFYAIRYYNDDFGRKRTYYLTLTSQSHNTLDFYLLNDTISNDVSVTIYDSSTLTLLEGAVIYLQRYFISSNEFKTVAMYESDTAGTGYFDIEQQIEKYKLLIDYPFNSRKLNTDSFYIEASSINVYLELISEIANNFFSQESITAYLSSSSSDFDVSWTDSSNVASEYCLTLKTLGAYGDNVIDRQCSNSNSGSLTVTGIINDTTNYGVFSAVIGGEEKVISVGFEEIVTDELDLGTYGLFLSILIMLVLVFATRIHYIASILAMLSLIFAKGLHLISIDWAYLFGLVFLSILIGIVFKLKTK